MLLLTKAGGELQLSPPCRGIRIRLVGFQNPWKFWLWIWNPGLWNPEYNPINRHPANDWTCESKFHWQKNPEPSPFFSYPLFTICSLALSFYFFVSLFIFQKFNLDSRAFLYCAWQRTKRAESKPISFPESALLCQPERSRSPSLTKRIAASGNEIESKQELWGRDCRQLSGYAHAHWCTGNYPLLFVLGRVRHGSLHAVSERTVRITRKPLLNWNERNALKTKYKTILFWFLTKNDTVELC